MVMIRIHSQSNAFLLKSEINSALKKDDKTIELFEEILKEKFNENILYSNKYKSKIYR